MSTFRLLNFGCRASFADGAAIKGQLRQAGLEEAAPEEQSDLTVLNTCTVTSAADAEIRQVIRRLHRANPACRILVTGCYAQRAPEEIAALPGVAWVVGNSHKHVIAELVRLGATPEGSEAHHRAAEVHVGPISDEFHYAAVSDDGRTRPTLKIQDGCDARCAFCVIPQVRGASRSLEPGQVVARVSELERCGFKEVVLSGINLGGYGRDLDRRIDFLGILERILAETAIARVRISSIEPMDVTPELISLVAAEPRIARHFHVPLQSGCDRILRLMNRRYWTRQYAERLSAIRERIPDCAIGADVMTGFPGETDQDHAATLGFIEALPLTYVHVFPYSSRPGTAAAAMSGQVNGRVSHQRGQEIRSLVARKRQLFLAAQVGRTLSVLILGDPGADERPEVRSSPRDRDAGEKVEAPAAMAISSNYLRVALPGSRVARNTLLDVRIGRVHDGVLYGRAESSDGSPPPGTCPTLPSVIARL